MSLYFIQHNGQDMECHKQNRHDLVVHVCNTKNADDDDKQ